VSSAALAGGTVTSTASPSRAARSGGAREKRPSASTAESENVMSARAVGDGAASAGILSAEAFDLFLLPQHVLQQDLDRDGLSELTVRGEVHRTEPARREPADQRVALRAIGREGIGFVDALRRRRNVGAGHD